MDPAHPEPTAGLSARCDTTVTRSTAQPQGIIGNGTEPWCWLPVDLRGRHARGGAQMSGYDETNPEAYRPTEPEAAADSAHSGVDSWSASSQAARQRRPPVARARARPRTTVATRISPRPTPPTPPIPSRPPRSCPPSRPPRSFPRSSPRRSTRSPPRGSTSPSSRPTSRSSSLRASTPLLRCSRRRRPATHPPSSPTRGSRRTSARPT